MKVRKTIKRALSMLLCVAMMMTTFDLSALTVRAGEGDGITVSDGNIVTVSGDDANAGDDLNITEGDESVSDDAIVDDIDDGSVSDANIDDGSVSDSNIQDSEEIQPVGGAPAGSTLTFLDQTHVTVSGSDYDKDYAGQVEYWFSNPRVQGQESFDPPVDMIDTDAITGQPVDEQHPWEIYTTSVDVSGVDTIYFRFTPDTPEDGARLDTTRGVIMRVNGTSTTLQANDEGFYTYTFSSTATQYQLEFGFEANNGGGGQPQPSQSKDLTVTVDLTTYIEEGAGVVHARDMWITANNISHYDVSFDESNSDVVAEEVHIGDDTLTRYANETVSINGIVNYNEEDEYLTLTFGFRPQNRPQEIKIDINNDGDYDDEEDIILMADGVTDEELLASVVCNGGGISYTFETNQVPIETDDLSVYVVQTIMDQDHMQVGNFWFENHEADPEGNNRTYYLPNGKVEVVSISYDVDGSGEIEEDEIFESVSINSASDNNYATGTMSPVDDENLPNYLYWYSPEVGHGCVIAPEGAIMTVKVVPDFGYQLTEFKARENVLTADPDVTCQYTFVVDNGLFALDAKITETSNVGLIAEDENGKSTVENISGATVTLGKDQTDMTAGVALIGIDGEISENTENNFVETISENDALDGYEIADSFDMYLENIVAKCNDSDDYSEDDYWIEGKNDLKTPATITFKLNGPVDDAKIIHEIWDDDKNEYVYVVIDGADCAYSAKDNTVTFATTSFSNFAIVTKGEGSPMETFSVDSSSATLYLSSAGKDVETDWNEFGGRYCADWLGFTATDENGNDILPDVEFKSSNESVVQVVPQYDEYERVIGCLIHGLKAGTATITATATYGGVTPGLTSKCSVTVKQGSIDVLQEKWAPVDAEGIPVDFDHFDENGQPVDAEEHPVVYEKWGPTGEMMVVNSFGNLVEANEWITNDWLLQYEDWKINPNSEEFWPSNYTVKVYKAQTITDSTLEALNYTFDRDGVLENANHSITFDLSEKTWTASVPFVLEDQMLFTNGTINANKDLEIGYTKTVDTENVTVSIGKGLTVNASNMYVDANTSIIVNGKLTVKGITKLCDYDNIIDNGNVTLNNVYVQTFDRENPGFIGIARYDKAALSINGNVESGGDVFLNVGLISAPVDYRDDDFTNDIIDNEENEGVLKPINSSKDELFKSSLSTFNCEWVRVWQPWSNQGTSFHITYYDKTEKAVYAGEEAFYVENITSQYHYGVSFAQWSDVATYVASINDADSEYVVNINVGEVEAFANFKFPKAVRSIIFRSNYILKDDEGNPIPEVDEESGEPVYDDENNPVYVIGGTLVKYTGDLILTTDTVFENIDFVRVDSDKVETPYTLTKVEIAGHVLTTRGKVTFNTPVNFTDNKKTGTLRVEGGNLFTAYVEVGEGQQYLENHAITKLIENDYEFEAANGAIIIAGQISNVGNIDIVQDQLMVVTDYMTQTRGKYTFNAPVFTPVNLFVNDGTVIIANENAPYFKDCQTNGVFTQEMKTAAGALSTKAKATVTNATIGGYFKADEMQLTNVQLGNWDEIPATIYSKGTFNITGILTSSTGFNTLVTTNDSKGVPYLNVSGTVIVNEDGHKIQVANVNEDGSYTVFTGKDKDGKGKDTTGSILLQTETGNIDQFAPYFEDNTHTNLPASCYENVVDPTSYIDCEFSANNINGYILKKSGNNIYVLKGEDVVVALARGSGYINDDNGNALKNAGDNIIGYYSSWGDAVVTINNLKDQNEQYEIIVVRDIGGETAENKPVTLSFPTAACLSMLQVTSIGDAGIYYTNGLTLTSNTIFEDVILAPVKKLNTGEYQGTALAINSGAYNLDMNGVDFSTVNGGSCTLASITGNGRNTVILGDINDNTDPYSDGLTMTGGITNVGTLNITNAMNLTIRKGDIKATNIVVSSEDVNITLEQGNITAEYIDAENDRNNIELTKGNFSVADTKVSSLFLNEGTITVKGTLTVSGYLELREKCKTVINTIELKENATFMIYCPVTISGTLVMRGNATLNSQSDKAALTIKDVVLEGTNNKIYTKRAANGSSNLKITGRLDTASNNKLVINEISETVASELTGENLNGNCYKVTPTAANMIANIGTIPSELITYRSRGNELEEKYVLVKYNGGLYYADSSVAPFNSNFVYLDKETVDEQENIAYYDHSRYLDWNEAVKEINSINDPTAKYRINIGAGVTDTNLTDKNQYGTLTLPGAKKCAGVTVKGSYKDANDPNNNPVLTFTNSSVTFTCNVEMDALKLIPTTGKLSFNLATYAFTLKDIVIPPDNYKITGITGGKNSVLDAISTYPGNAFTVGVFGNISNIATVELTNVNLFATGTLNVGNVINHGDTPATIYGMAKVTSKTVKGVEKPEITGITSNITITGTVTCDDPDYPLQVNLYNGALLNNDYVLSPDKITSTYSNGADFLYTTGITFAKALKADTNMIRYVNGADGMIIKKNGNLVWVDRDRVPYELRYGNNSVPCLTFADAVTEIKNLNNKEGVYTIILKADAQHNVNAEYPENFTMPAANTLKSLTIKPEGSTPVNLYYGTYNASTKKTTAVAKLAFASDTTIENVNFIDAEAAANLVQGDYPNRAALNVSFGGKYVTFDNVTFEGRGVIFDGGKGTMAIGAGGLVAGTEPVTLESAYPECSIVQGEIKNLSAIVTKGYDTFGTGAGETLVITRYVSAANGTCKDGALATVTNLNLNRATIQVDGSINVTNITTGAEEEQSIVMSDTAFTVSGTVTAGHVDNLALIGRQKNDNKNKNPQMTISGTVGFDSCPVAIGILPYYDSKSEAPKSYDTLDIPDTGLSLATASKCTADRFVTLTDLTMEGNVAASFVTNGFDPTKSSAQRGIGLVKSGSLIMAYDGSYIHIVLAKVADATTGNVPVTGENVIGYYHTIKEATDAINTLNNKNAQYGILLLDNYGSANETITIPTNAKTAGICIESTDYYENKLTLKSLALANNVTLSNIIVNVHGAVTSTKGTTLTLTGTEVCITPYGSVTLENIVNKCTARSLIMFSRTTKNASQLKINGTVENTTNKTIQLWMINDEANYQVSDYVSSTVADITKGNTKQLFVAPKVMTGDVKIYITDGNSLLKDTEERTLVKAKDAFYYVSNEEIGDEIVCLSVNDGTPGKYLDMNQALLQIKALADSTNTYTVNLFGNVSDTDVLDTTAHSKINMPATNTADSISVIGEGDTITYSGDITAYVAAGGSLTFEDIILENVNPDTGQNVETGKITLNRNSADKTGEVTLVFDGAELACLNQICGTKGVSNVDLGTSEIKLKTGFSNINKLYVAERVTTGGANKIGEIHLKDNNSEFISVGATTVDYVYVDTANLNLDDGAPIIAAKKADNFKINKTVDPNEGNVIDVYFLTAGSTYAEPELLYDADAYLDTNLVYAPLADASALRSGMHTDTDAYVAYKFGNYVRVGNADDMVIQITSPSLNTYAKSYKDAIDAINTWKTKEDYTITFREVDFYTTTATGIVDEDKANSWGTMTFPNAANASSLTIKGMVYDNGTPDDIWDDRTTTLQFTGAIKPSVDTRFEDITLDSGKVVNKAFESAYEMALDLSAASLDMYNANNHYLMLSSIKGTKGTLTLGYGEDSCSVYVSDTINIGNLNIRGAVDISVASDVTALKSFTIGSIIGCSDTGDKLEIDAPIGTAPMLKITGNVDLHDSWTVGEDTFEAGELVIKPVKKDSSGEIRYYYDNELDKMLVNGSEKQADLNKKKLVNMPMASTTNVSVRYMYYDGEADCWCNSIYDMPTWERDNNDSDYAVFTKVGGCGYLTQKSNISVEVAGTNGYESQLMSFTDAVTEIDKINDKRAEYEINIIGEQNGLVNCWSSRQYGNVALPKNAAKVTISGHNGDHADEPAIICTTGSTVSATVPTVFENVNFISVKQKTTNATFGYFYIENPTRVSIEAKVSLEIKGCELNVNKISGNALTVYGSDIRLSGGMNVKDLVMKSGLEVVRYNYDTKVNENLVLNARIFQSVKQAITVTNSADIEGGSEIENTIGNISMKNATISGVVYGGILAFTGTTTLDGASVEAIGDNANGQGKVSFQNIVLGENGSLLVAKVDASNKSQISITGTIGRASDTYGSCIEFALLSNFATNDREGAEMKEGMICIIGSAKLTDDMVDLFFIGGVEMAKAGNNIIAKSFSEA